MNKTVKILIAISFSISSVLFAVEKVEKVTPKKMEHIQKKMLNCTGQGSCNNVKKTYNFQAENMTEADKVFKKLIEADQKNCSNSTSSFSCEEPK